MAYDGGRVEVWFYYAAVKEYRKKPGNQDTTSVPIDRSFKSPFVGQSVGSVAEWLRGASEDVGLERKFFAVLDEKVEASEPSVALCRIGDGDGKVGEVRCILWNAKASSLMLAGFECGDFDEIRKGRGEYKPGFRCRTMCDWNREQCCIHLCRRDCRNCSEAAVRA